MAKWFRLIFKFIIAVCNTLLDTLYPKYCIVCGKMLPAGVDYCVCRKCKAQQHTKARNLVDNPCGCAEIISPFIYDGIVRRSMLRFKFKGIRYIGHTFAVAMAAMLRDREFAKGDCLLVPIPIHINRDREYNQSEVLAEYISEITGIPVYDGIIRKIRPIGRISGMPKRDKQFYIQDSFHFDAGCNFTGKTVIITDDIYTSGTTLKEFADLMKMHGAEKVYAITACVTE